MKVEEKLKIANQKVKKADNLIGEAQRALTESERIRAFRGALDKILSSDLIYYDHTKEGSPERAEVEGEMRKLNKISRKYSRIVNASA